MLLASDGSGRGLPGDCAMPGAGYDPTREMRAEIREAEQELLESRAAIARLKAELARRRR